MVEGDAGAGTEAASTSREVVWRLTPSIKRMAGATAYAQRRWPTHRFVGGGWAGISAAFMRALAPEIYAPAIPVTHRSLCLSTIAPKEDAK